MEKQIKVIVTVKHRKAAVDTLFNFNNAGYHFVIVNKKPGKYCYMDLDRADAPT